MKKIIFFIIILPLSLFATNYETIDISGVIKWSTDGGQSDCNCTPDYENKSDFIYVNHPYTFTNAEIGGLDVNAYMKIETGVSSPVVFVPFVNLREAAFEIVNSVVEFQDGIFTRLKNSELIITNSEVTYTGAFKLDETTALVSGGSTIVFNNTCEVFGKKNAKAGNFFVSGNSTVDFNGNVYGDIKGDGRISFGESTCDFATAISIQAVKMDINSLATLTANNGVSVVSSEINVAENANVVMYNNINFIDANLTANTPNLVLGTGAIFNSSVLDFGEFVNGFFWGDIQFDGVEVFIRNGAVMGFLSGIEYRNSILNVDEGGIADFTDAHITNGELFIHGLLKSDTTTIITESDMEVTSTGIVDLTHSYYCDFDRTKVNNKKASDELVCSGTWNPDQNDFKIWENGVWSGNGLPPNNVGVYAEIKEHYQTGLNGDILCGSLTINDSVLVKVDSLGFIHATQTFNNGGLLVIENKGSLLMDPQTRYLENNGRTSLKIRGAVSQMSYNVWSTPVRDTFGILTDFILTNPCDVYAFEAGIQNWKYDYEEYTTLLCGIPPDTQTVVFTENDIIPNADGLMDIGRGYFVPGNNLWATRFFTGIVNNGVINHHIETTAIGSNPDWDNDDWNLIGNPYPSGLDLNAFWARNASFQNAMTDGIYFWVETKEPPYDQYGSYLTWNFSGGTYLPQTRTEVSIVPPGMGFWVLANDPDGSGSFAYDVEFNNTMRVSFAGTTSADRYVSKKYDYDEEHHKIWMNLTNDSLQYDQILIATHPEATDTIDLLFDAHKNYGGEPLALAMVNGNEAFTIQGFAPRVAVDTTMIELVVLASNSSSHYLTIDSSRYFLDHKRVYLVDSLKGTEYEMKLGMPLTLDIDSANRYTNRFYLKITNSFVLNVADGVIGSGVKIWASNSRVNLSSKGILMDKVKVYDLSGVLIRQFEPKSAEYQFILNDVSSGIYLIEAITTDGQRAIERVYVNP